MGKSSFFLKFFILILAGCLFFTSCENFLNGENIKEDIVKQIYIANNDCPVANVEEPAFSDSGVARNKAIIISFTKAIKPETFASSYTITDSQGNNLKDNFMEPEWSNENKLVTIPANEQNYIDLRGKRTIDIYFTLSTSCETPDGLPISSAINHKYRINDSVDNTAPEISENTYAERPPIYFNNNLISQASGLYEGILDSDNEWMVCNINHINSKVTVYIEGKDYGGGSVKGHIVSRRIADVVGSNVSEAAKNFVFDLAKMEDSENSSGSYTLDLSSQDYQDGLYEVKLYVQDSANLDSEENQTYYVIRDTRLAYSITSRMINDTPVFRNDIPDIPVEGSTGRNGQPVTYQAGEYEYLVGQRAFNIQTPTLRKIQDFRTRILFDQINDDVYYTSSLTNNTYAENDLTYFVSYGLDNEHLSIPEKIEGQYYSDRNITSVSAIKYYTLPQGFIDFANENENSDIILKAIVLDSVGNQNVITSLWPKKIDFYNYTVSADGEKKKVELNFSNLAVNDTFEDKRIHGKYRIFYASWGNHAEDEELSDLELKRNCDVYKANSDSTDLLEIKGLEPNSKYVVYVQTAYDAESIYNGQYCSTTFGPLKKIIVDTARTAGGTPTQPVFTVNKIGGDKNSGLYTLEINITSETYDSNLRYIPYYWDVIKLEYWAEEPEGSKNWVHHPDEWGWLKLDSHKGERIFNISVNNHLKAPLKKQYDEEGYLVVDGNLRDNGAGAWVCYDWDFTANIDPVTNQKLNDGPDNTYYKAVENCGNNYPTVPAKLKLVAVNDTDTTESAEVEFRFHREDDTIPPAISSKIVRHDSHLSFDGHSFEFNDLIREDEGNLTEYFTYYYTPYNPAWGDNLNVLSEDQIKMLPSGRAAYTGSTWLDPFSEPSRANEACYRLDTSIPIFGLPDGDYMYFARLDDRFGNYRYATLGKAHIGTFKNKLKVELDEDRKYFKSTLELEPDECFFDRNMINVQVCWDTKWDNYYEWLNDVQDCKKETRNGKLCLYSHISDTDDPNIFVYKRGEGSSARYEVHDLPKNDGGADNASDRVLSTGVWYRITMQSFNENSMIAEGGDGVSYKYGRPYTTVHDCDEGDDDENYHNLWSRELWHVEGEQKYDVCTEETVSNTVYYYVPWENNNDREDFSDYYASFFSGTATPRSNHSLLVNVFASYRDLGNDPDEWERRGKLVATHKYNQWDSTTRSISCDFNQSVAAEDVSKAREQGLVYYAAVVHFAKGESAVSDVYTMYGF